MLIDLISGQLSFTSALMGILASLLIIFLVLPFHEWAHGYAAYKLGDKTAKYSGRLRFNPLAHIDPFGALCLVLFGFGWAKPCRLTRAISSARKQIWRLSRCAARLRTSLPRLPEALF